MPQRKSIAVAYRGKQIQLRNGDIVLFRDNFMWTDLMTVLSALVRFLTRSYFNHCGIVVEKDGILYFNEALAQGVVSRPLQDHLDREKCEITVLRGNFISSHNYLTARAMSKVGIPYDYASLILFQLIYRLTGMWLGRKYSNAARAMVCSEYVAWCYALPGWWFYSVKELQLSNMFYTIFYEEESSVTEADLSTSIK